MKQLTFEQLRKQALQVGIKDNHSAIGLWIKKQGYKKKQIRNGLERYRIYYLDAIL